jgi:hypothetical protein
VNLFVNTAADAKASLVISQSNNNAATLLPVFAGDVLPLSVIFTDGQGGFADFTGQAGVKILFAVGVLTTRTAYTTTQTLSHNAGAYEATLDLATVEMLAALDGEESVQLHLEIQASFTTETETLCQQVLTVRNQLIS